MATLYYSSSSLEIPDGVTASIITGITMNDDGTVTVDEEDLDGVIPAGCAVILRGNAGKYSFEQTDNGSYPENNLLQGTDEPTTDTEGGYLYFTLDSENGENSAPLKDWIYVGNVVSIGPHKAYLKLSEAEYPELAAMLGALDNPHLQHTHGGCEICDEITGVEAIQAAWGASADDLTEGTLEDAIFDAGEEGSNIGYIKLLADVESDVYVGGGNFTLDLNGYTISSESHTLYIRNNSNVTIVDNSETKSGKVISSGEGSFAVCVTNSASVTIEEGTYESTNHALNVEENSSATINGGSYESPFRPVVIGEGCSATITGGTFTSKNNYAIYNDGTLNIAGGTFISEVHYTLNTKGTLIIKGGEFSAGENFAVLEYSGGTIDLSEFDQGITAISVKNTSYNDIVPGEETILLPEGYCFYKGEKNVTELVYTESYTIGEATAIAEAKWGTSADALTSYGTLDEAFAATYNYGDGNETCIPSEVRYIQLQSDVTSESGYVVCGGTFTLDLNGKTLQTDSHTLEMRGGEVTITDESSDKSGKVITTGSGAIAVYINEGSPKITIEGGQYKSNNQSAVSIDLESCEVTINGGEFTTTESATQLITNHGTLTINGGTFDTQNAQYAIYVGGNTTISDGTFVEAQTADVMYCGGTLTFEATEATDETPGFSPMGLSVDYQAEDGVVADIILPEGYDFYNSDDEAVTDFQYDLKCYIGKEEGAGFTVTFHANNGTEETTEETVESPTGKYTLPECDFTAPEGKMFKAWLVGEEEYQPEDEIVVTEDTEVEAVWTEYVPQIVIKMSDSYGDGWNGASITVKKDGEELDETVTIENGTEATVTLVYDLDSRYTFYWNMGSNDGECEFKIIVSGKTKYTGLGSDFSDDIELFFALGDPFVVSFNANDGSGSMDDIETYESSVTLPECTFTAPEGMMFDSWQVGDDEENLYQPGEEITVTADTEVTAVWGDIKIVINMSDSYGDGWGGAYIEVLENGDSIGTATLENGYDGRATFDYDSNCTYSFIWHYGLDEFEISFKISIGEEQLFTSEEGDCEEYADGQQIYPVPTLDELSIADGSIEEFYYTKTIVGTLTYTRTLPNLVWNALYVPFEIPVSELLDNYDVAYINDVHSFDNDDNGEIDDLKMEVIKITTGTLKANYPYLIRAKNEEAMEMSIVLTDATLYATKENTVTCSSVFMKFDVKGTYAQMSSEDLKGSLVITSDGSWKQLAESSVLRPFRLYLTMTAIDGSPVKVSEQAARSMRIVARGESEGTTSIDNGQWTIDNEPAVIYDLMGRRVLEPQKGGIYIVDGKKVVW